MLDMLMLPTLHALPPLERLHATRLFAACYALRRYAVVYFCHRDAHTMRHGAADA